MTIAPMVCVVLTVYNLCASFALRPHEDPALPPPITHPRLSSLALQGCVPTISLALHSVNLPSLHTFSLGFDLKSLRTILHPLPPNIGPAVKTLAVMVNANSQAEPGKLTAMLTSTPNVFDLTIEIILGHSTGDWLKALDTTLPSLKTLTIIREAGVTISSQLISTVTRRRPGAEGTTQLTEVRLTGPFKLDNGVKDSFEDLCKLGIVSYLRYSDVSLFNSM